MGRDPVLITVSRQEQDLRPAKTSAPHRGGGGTEGRLGQRLGEPLQYAQPVETSATKDCE
jgi:hypothetical protein